MPARPNDRPNARLNAPQDQAHGLRAMFGSDRTRFVPLVHNAHVPGGGVVMERLCAAIGEHGLHTLVVDAADSASAPHELAAVDLAACVEPLSANVSYLAARGLPRRFLDNRATMVGLLDALHMAAPKADVVLLHAGASDLRRIFAGRAPRPILLAGNRPDSLTDAYASMKLLSQWLGALAFDLIIAADTAPKRARKMAERLGECADLFLGSALHHCAVVDPLAPVRAELPPALRRLMAAQLHSDDQPAVAGLVAPPRPPLASPTAWPAVPAASASATTLVAGRHEFPTLGSASVTAAAATSHTLAGNPVVRAPRAGRVI